MWMLHSLCVKPFRLLGLLIEKQKITLQQCFFMQCGAYITVKVESLQYNEVVAVCLHVKGLLSCTGTVASVVSSSFDLVIYYNLTETKLVRI